MMQNILAFDNERYSRWTNAFIVVQNVGQPITFEKNAHWFWILEITRGLARFDAKLVTEDRWAATLFDDETQFGVEKDRFNDHVTLSQLWVMGAYELLRTIVEQLKNNEKDDKKRHDECRKIVKRLKKRQGQKTVELLAFKPDPFQKRAQELLQEYERLRMPIAKLQSANAFMAGNPIARPGLSCNGIGWIIRADMFVTRMELADKMIDVLNGYTPIEMEEKSRALANQIACKLGCVSAL